MKRQATLHVSRYPLPPPQLPFNPVQFFEEHLLQKEKNPIYRGGKIKKNQRALFTDRRREKGLGFSSSSRNVYMPNLQICAVKFVALLSVYIWLF